MKPGDLVTLKCGGPQMVIDDVDDASGIYAVIRCLWFDTQGRLQNDTFRREVLVAENPEQSIHDYDAETKRLNEAANAAHRRTE